VGANVEGAIKLNWQSESNTLYRVEFASDLTNPATWDVLTDQYASHGTNTFWLDTGDYFQKPPVLHPRKVAARFYRIANEGTNTGPSPNVVIMSPSSSLVATGSLTISVAASTDQATISTKLYVDGEYFPIVNTASLSGQYVRMSEMSLGSDLLRWMAIFACHSLDAHNVQSMRSAGIQPFNNKLHLLLGVDSITYPVQDLGRLWADNMLNQGMTVLGAYLAAGQQLFPPIAADISFAVWGFNDCKEDTLQSTNSPGGGIFYESDPVN
jgi:hypothetical protein